MTELSARIGWWVGKGSARFAVAVLACGMIFPGIARASCARSSGRTSLVIPAFHAVPNSARMAQGRKVTKAGASSTSIVGLWHVVFVSGGQQFDEGFDQWHSDGTEILNDNAVPPAEGNVCLGVFTRTAPGTYSLNHPAWNWDANGNLIGTVVFLENVTVDPGGNSYQGSFTFDTFDLSGNLLSEVTGTLTADRITPD